MLSKASTTLSSHAAVQTGLNHVPHPKIHLRTASCTIMGGASRKYVFGDAIQHFAGQQYTLTNYKMAAAALVVFV